MPGARQIGLALIYLAASAAALGLGIRLGLSDLFEDFGASPCTRAAPLAQAAGVWWETMWHFGLPLLGPAVLARWFSAHIPDSQTLPSRWPPSRRLGAQRTLAGLPHLALLVCATAMAGATLAQARLVGRLCDAGAFDIAPQEGVKSIAAPWPPLPDWYHRLDSATCSLLIIVPLAILVVGIGIGTARPGQPPPPQA